MKKIKYLVMDVDGTLTDGVVYMGENGEVCKAFNIKDGYGIYNIAIPAGIEPIIMTGRKSVILLNRCKELGITQIHQGISDKVSQLKVILNGDSLDTVAYIGDDLNDLECMNMVRSAGGVTGCPADAVLTISKTCNFISKKNGGHGAVREFIDWIIERNGENVV